MTVLKCAFAITALALLIAAPARAAPPENSDKDAVMDCVERSGSTSSCRSTIIQPCSKWRGAKNRYRYPDCLSALMMRWRQIAAERANAARFKMPLGAYKKAERAVQAYKTGTKKKCAKDAATLNDVEKTTKIKQCELYMQVQAATAMRNPDLIQHEGTDGQAADTDEAEAAKRSGPQWKRAK